ncbi:hypothetical protein Sjap_003333 [Stephania japonica]|uniref:Uncharacterized protein n=1 Tax=Stephania japonica TaxID=461633 RepID=A0AAP0KQ52_9MAGN
MTTHGDSAKAASACHLMFLSPYHIQEVSMLEWFNPLSLIALVVEVNRANTRKKFNRVIELNRLSRTYKHGEIHIEIEYDRFATQRSNVDVDRTASYLCMSGLIGVFRETIVYMMNGVRGSLFLSSNDYRSGLLASIFCIPGRPFIVDISRRNTTLEFDLLLKNHNKEFDVFYDQLNLTIYHGGDLSHTVANLSIPAFP